MFEHGIVQDAIAPFFVILALVTVVSRVALVAPNGSDRSTWFDARTALPAD